MSRLKNIVERRILFLVKAKYEITIYIIKNFYEILNIIFDDFDKKTIA